MPGPESPSGCRTPASGPALFDGLIRQADEDFQVEEIPAFPLCGEGEHDYLHVEKVGQNTAWVAERLAKYAGLPPRDVGYAGLKDRHAITRQWFSVRRKPPSAHDWSLLDLPGVRLLEVTRHRRKLQRGAHAGNRFRIVVRLAGSLDTAVAQALQERRRHVAAAGVPNYFGSQRFGKEGHNLGLASDLFAGKRMSRSRRSLALSAARSAIFNEVLNRRVRDGTWREPLAGDWLMLDGTNSGFRADEIDEELRARCRRLDLHPSGPLWGRAGPQPGSSVLELERHCALQHESLARGLEAAGVASDRRPLRCTAGDLDIETAEREVVFRFTLQSGSYATSLLAEFCTTHDAARPAGPMPARSAAPD